MTYKEKEARELVIRAGHKLLESGLVARTWGNISARVSSTHFVITPSGRAYDTLQPDQLVLVRISDCSYEGNIKPSSEKGIHAAAYLHRPDAGVVIHTHQDYASCIGVTGKHMTELNHPILGDCVPCAAYGMPSTKKLQHNVDKIMVQFPKANAILMRNHGALFMARDFDRAFELALALEEVSRKMFESAVTLPDPGQAEVKSLLATLQSGKQGLHFAPESHNAVQAVAVRGKTMRPYLDDLAQIAGVTIRCTKNNATAVAKAMRGRNAVLIPGIGAICCAEDESDVPAIASILRKSCMAALYAASCGAAPLSGLDCRIMRLVYQMKYSKKKQGD